METEEEKDETKSINVDEKIREGQWKNCLGCLAYSILILVVALMALKKCAAM